MEKKSLIGSLPIYAQHLSEMSGVQVVVQGTSAYTDGTKVVVPFTDQDPRLSFGYIAHETSHVRNTDMECFEKTRSTPFRQSVLNILEDIRIERLSMEQYPGTEGDLNYLVKQVLGEHLDPQVVAAKPPLHIVHDTLLIAGRWAMLGQDLEQPAEVMLQAQEALLGSSLSQQIMQKVGEVLRCNNTPEVLALADAIIALYPSQEDQQKDNPKQDQPQDQPQEQSSEGDQSQDHDQSQEGDEQSSGSDGGGDGDGDESGKPGKSGKSNQEAGQPDSEGKKSAGNQGNDGQGDQQGQPSGSGNGSSESRDQDQGQQPTPTNSKPASQAQNLREQANTATDVDLQGLISEVGDKAAEMLGNKARTDPTVGNAFALSGRTNNRGANASSARVRSGQEMSSGLRQSLNGLLQAQVDCRVRLKRQGTRIDTSRIAMLKAGETRVFRSKARAERQSAAIEILLDRSSSMQSAMDDAEAAVYAVLQALEGIPLVTTGAMSFPEVAFRNESCALIKSHKERLAEAVAKGGFGAYANGYTPLAQALWPAAVEVLRAKGERKILFVITDGQPDNVRAARAMVVRCENSGIDVIGLGFGAAKAEALVHTFTRFRAIGEVGKLKQALFELTREVLTA